MLIKKIITILKKSHFLSMFVFIMVLPLILISLLAGCVGSTTTSQSPVSSAVSSTAAPTTTVAPTTNTTAVRPQEELVAAFQKLGNENWLPWLDPSMPSLHDIVYDMLIYWDNVNHQFIPGLAESWENSPDGLTLIYHLRKGVEFSDGWGEFTSADVKYNFEMHASKTSVGKTSQTRRIASMDTPDPYTLVVHFKDPYPTFYVDLSMGNSGTCQGIVCKKYLETVGEEAASQKPVGTGPYKLIESKSGDYMKFEALGSHWRVVPEFKYLTARIIPEVSTLVAALKNREIDVAQVPFAQLADLKTAGLAVEVSSAGGTILAGLGGMVVPEDKRYDVTIHNKDPWVDPKVRKAMAISIDRVAICKAIYAGYAEPAGVPLYTAELNKFQYPYDPVAAKQLLKEAGYPDGFTFRVMSYVFQTLPETVQIAEALAGYWQQIGLDPKITVIDSNTYNNKNRVPLKTAGDISLIAIGVVADELSRAELVLIPNGVNICFEDAGSYAIYRDNPKSNLEQRNMIVDKLNQYYYENVGPIPVVRIGVSFAWKSDKVSPWPHSEGPEPFYLEYIRHAQPLNTFRLFTPYPGR